MDCHFIVAAPLVPRRSSTIRRQRGTTDARLADDRVSPGGNVTELDRRGKVLRGIDPTTEVGLEVGPLDRPAVAREIGTVYYIDHADTDTLRRKYGDDPSVSTQRIVDVDFVWGQETLQELLAPVAPLDYAIASHVIEHVPDLVGWLKEVSEVLRDGGLLSLVIPDKRFTFDYFRDGSSPAEAVEAYFRNSSRPSPGQVFDHYSTVVFLEAQQAWTGDPGNPERKFSDEIAWTMCQQAAEGEYVDVHCWVFTPGSFVDMLRNLANLGLTEFGLKDYFLTQRNDNEFFVTLERLPRGLSPEETLRRQLESLPTAEALDGGARAWPIALPSDGVIVKREEVAALRLLVGRQERRIEELESSTSWRVTAPLRTAARWLRSPRRN